MTETKSDNSHTPTPANLTLLPMARVPDGYAGLDEHELRGQICAHVKLALDLEALVALANYLESEAFSSARSRRILDISSNSFR
jgi:hypothetical protein